MRATEWSLNTALLEALENLAKNVAIEWKWIGAAKTILSFVGDRFNKLVCFEKVDNSFVRGKQTIIYKLLWKVL